MVLKFKSTQRIASLIITMAYRTTSIPALNVLTSIPPLDLTIVRETKYHRVTKLGKRRRNKRNQLPTESDTVKYSDTQFRKVAELSI